MQVEWKIIKMCIGVYVCVCVCLCIYNNFSFYLKHINENLFAKFGRTKVLSLRISLVTEGLHYLSCIKPTQNVYHL